MSDEKSERIQELVAIVAAARERTWRQEEGDRLIRERAERDADK